MRSSYRARFELGGKTAVVTGGAGILGRHFCRGLAEFGARVAVVDIDGPRARELAADIAQDYGVASVGVACDVASPDSVRAMVATVLETLGPIHVLHNNAASKGTDLAAFLAATEAYRLETWRQVMAVNLDGMFLVAQAVGTQMQRQGSGGSIVQTASIYGLRASDRRIYEGSDYLGRPIANPAVYSASKAAVCGLSRQLAADWAGHGIRVNTLVPGGVESGQNEGFQRRYGARVPLGRMAMPEEMVGALVFLASDASSYVTGQELVVDGGLSAW
jgi:NAD(P)-dependent dehydrogenase (short-subunit alcohol dehydrogenase family)